MNNKFVKFPLLSYQSPLRDYLSTTKNKKTVKTALLGMQNSRVIVMSYI